MRILRSRSLLLKVRCNIAATLERRLGRHGVFDRFDAIVTRADVAQGKPAPDIYLEVARRLDARPDACLVLEDSAIGCEAALAAGMRVVAEACDGVEAVRRGMEVMRGKSARSNKARGRTPSMRSQRDGKSIPSPIPLSPTQEHIMAIQSYRDLRVWHTAMDLVDRIYDTPR